MPAYCGRKTWGEPRIRFAHGDKLVAMLPDGAWLMIKKINITYERARWESGKWGDFEEGIAISKNAGKKEKWAFSF